MEPAPADPKSRVILTRSNRLEILDYLTEKVSLTVPLGSSKSQVLSGVSPCKKLFWAHNDEMLVILNFKETIVLQKKYEHTIDSFYFIDKAHIAVILRESKEKSRIEILHGPTQKLIFKVVIDFGQRRREFLKAVFTQKLVWFQSKIGTVEIAKMDLENQAITERREVVTELAVSKLMIFGEFVYVISDSIRNEQNKPISRVQVFHAFTGDLLAKRDFKGVQEANVKGSPDGQFGLIMVSKYVDRTNESYYGRDGLFSFVATPVSEPSEQGIIQYKCSIQKMETYLGNIHDWQLVPKMELAVVTSGKMPSRTVIYNFKGNPVYLLEHAFRNTIRVAPNHTVMALAGFGQLSGDIKLFSLKNHNLIGMGHSSYASWLKWSSDGVKFITATVLAKLNENHQFSIFDYKGTLLKKMKVKENDLVSADFYYSAKLVKKLNLTDFVMPEKRTRSGLLGGALDKPKKIVSMDIKAYNKEQKGPAPGLGIGGVRIFQQNQKGSNKPGLTFGVPKLTRKRG